MRNSYTFTPVPKDEKFYLTFAGDFSSGEQFNLDKTKIETQAKKAVESHIVIFDLSQVIFWDTETMNFIKALLVTLNTGKTRAGIVASKQSYIFNRFVEKFGPIIKPVYWAESEVELISQLN